MFFTAVPNLTLTTVVTHVTEKKSTIGFKVHDIRLLLDSGRAYFESESVFDRSRSGITDRSIMLIVGENLTFIFDF